MKKIAGNLEKEIISFMKKLPKVKKMEALDFVKWLWISARPAESYKNRYERLLKKIWRRVEKEPITEKEIDKIVEEARSERYAKSGC